MIQFETKMATRDTTKITLVGKEGWKKFKIAPKKQ